MGSTNAAAYILLFLLSFCVRLPLGLPGGIAPLLVVDVAGIISFAAEGHGHFPPPASALHLRVGQSPRVPSMRGGGIGRADGCEEAISSEEEGDGGQDPSDPEWEGCMWQTSQGVEVPDDAERLFETASHVLTFVETGERRLREQLNLPKTTLNASEIVDGMENAEETAIELLERAIGERTATLFSLALPLPPLLPSSIPPFLLSIHPSIPQSIHPFPASLPPSLPIPTHDPTPISLPPPSNSSPPVLDPRHADSLELLADLMTERDPDTAASLLHRAHAASPGEGASLIALGAA